MNKRILTQLVTAATGLVLPLSLVAQDYSDQSGSELPGSSATTSGSAGQSSGSPGSGGFSFGSSSTSSQSQPGTFSSGIMVHDGAAYIVHRLQNEMSLPDGSKVQPNGTIRENNGSTRSIDPGKMLTLDGREMEAPFGKEHEASSSSPSKMPGSNSSGMSNPSSLPGSSSSMPDKQSGSSSSQIPPTTSAPSSDSGVSGSSSDQSGSSSSSIPGSSSQSSGFDSDSGSISTKDGTDLH